MEILLVACLAALLVALALALAAGSGPPPPPQADLADIEQATAAAKRRITELHRAYRTELARAVKARAAERRTR